MSAAKRQSVHAGRGDGRAFDLAAGICAVHGADEWPSMAHAERAQETSRLLGELYAGVLSIDTTTNREQSVYHHSFLAGSGLAWRGVFLSHSTGRRPNTGDSLDFGTARVGLIDAWH